MAVTLQARVLKSGTPEVDKVRVRRHAAVAVLGALAVTGCSSQSQAEPTPAQVSATLAAQGDAMLSSTARCPEADWRCIPDTVSTVGGTLLGPAKSSSLRVTGMLVWPAESGQALRGIAVQLPRPGGTGYMALTELPGTADLTPTQTWTHTTRVQGTTALFDDEPQFVKLKWNQHGRQMTLSVAKHLPGAVPTEAQMLAAAQALVPYSA